MNFDKVERKQINPPFKPNLVSNLTCAWINPVCQNNISFSQLNALDVSYFDSTFTEEDALISPVPDDFIESMNQEQFKGFSYTDPNYTLPAL